MLKGMLAPGQVVQTHFLVGSVHQCYGREGGLRVHLAHLVDTQALLKNMCVLKVKTWSTAMLP